MRILVVGLGSIGKRHIENLEALGIACADIGLVRRPESSNPLGDEFLKSHPVHPVFTDLHKALKTHAPSAAFITNPTSLHIASALECARAGVHLFIEKPLSHSLDGVFELKEEVRRRGLSCVVGYHLRFHPLLNEVKRWLDAGAIGKVISADVKVGQRISDWHPGEDYRISYAVRADLGGGAILTLSHELDYLIWLFGRPQWVFAVPGAKSDLEINTEESVKSLIGFPEPEGVAASFHADYLQRPPQRTLEVIGQDGRIRLDFISGQADLIPVEPSVKATRVLAPEGFQANDMYLEEVRRFLESVEQGHADSAGLESAVEVLILAVAMQQSMRSHSPVAVSES